MSNSSCAWLCIPQNGKRRVQPPIRGEQYGFHGLLTHWITQDVILKKYLWDATMIARILRDESYASVRNILVEESYTGVLNNHHREYNNGKTKHIDKADWYRHEGFFPVIIGKQEWEQVQRLLKQQARPANGNQAKHRYAGLLTCRECGNTFIPMIRCWNGKSRVEYVCRGYHRNGKTYCASHRIHEEVLDAAVQEYAETVRKQCAEELKKLVQLQKMWALRKPILDAHISALQKKVQELEREIDEIVIEKLKGSVSNPRPR